MKISAMTKKCLLSVIVHLSQNTSSKLYNLIDNSSKLVIGKMKDENGDVAIEEFVRLKPKIFSFLETIMNRKKQKARIKILLQQ